MEEKAVASVAVSYSLVSPTFLTFQNPEMNGTKQGERQA